MEINNLSVQEQSSSTSQMSETDLENEMNQELNSSELDAIAGGCGIPTITSNSKPPKFRGPSMKLFEVLSKLK